MEMSKTRMRGEMMREKREHIIDKNEGGKDEGERRAYNRQG